MLWLKISGGTLDGQQLLLVKDEHRLGSGPEAHIRLPAAPGVKPLHALLRWTVEGFAILPARGVRVTLGGDLITSEEPVALDEPIEIGPYVLRIVEESASRLRASGTPVAPPKESRPPSPTPPVVPVHAAPAAGAPASPRDDEAALAERLRARDQESAELSARLAMVRRVAERHAAEQRVEVRALEGALNERDARIAELTHQVAAAVHEAAAGTVRQGDLRRDVEHLEEAIAAERLQHAEALEAERRRASAMAEGARRREADLERALAERRQKETEARTDLDDAKRRIGTLGGAVLRLEAEVEARAGEVVSERANLAAFRDAKEREVEKLEARIDGLEAALGAARADVARLEAMRRAGTADAALAVEVESVREALRHARSETAALEWRNAELESFMLEWQVEIEEKSEPARLVRLEYDEKVRLLERRVASLGREKRELEARRAAAAAAGAGAAADRPAAS